MVALNINVFLIKCTKKKQKTTDFVSDSYLHWWIRGLLLLSVNGHGRSDQINGRLDGVLLDSLWISRKLYYYTKRDDVYICNAFIKIQIHHILIYG